MMRKVGLGGLGELIHRDLNGRFWKAMFDDSIWHLRVLKRGYLSICRLYFCYETCTVIEWGLACFTRHSRWDLWPQHVKTCCFCIAHIHQPVI
jgi:hypothetical protein